LERNYQELLRLERLIGQLSELTRLESGDFKPQRQIINLRQVTDHLGQAFNDLASKHALSIQNRVASDLEVSADPHLLERALANIIDNAIRYSQGPGEITLQAWLDQDAKVHIAIENPGLVPLALRDRIFDRLFRGDTARNSEGSGLGLAIVQAIAVAHNGQIQLECSESTGITRFILSLPPILT
jgi:signal transduction histidine kinase